MTKAEQIARKRVNNSGRAVKYFGVDSFKEIDSEKHIIEIKFAAFGNIDSDRDILIKGCFAKSIQERGPGSSTTGRSPSSGSMTSMTDREDSENRKKGKKGHMQRYNLATSKPCRTPNAPTTN